MSAADRDMVELGLGEALDHALDVAMAEDPRIVVFGEDVPMLRRGLLARHGPDRVRGTPISESAFLGAGVGAAMAGLRPVVEIMLVDFLAVCLSALQNEAAMIPALSGGRQPVPMVVRATCGGGYGDAGQHEQALWGMLAGIPGLVVAVPSTPADAAGLMCTALRHDGPVVLLEHTLLSATWLDWLAGSRRPGLDLDVPAAGARGPVALRPEPVPFGAAMLRRDGGDLAIVSVAVGVHRALEAAERLHRDHGVDAAVVDLRTVAPLDADALVDLACRCTRVLVVDEDYVAFGLTGEVAAVVAGSAPGTRYARVATAGTIPYARHLEERALPSVDRIVEAALGLCTA